MSGNKEDLFQLRNHAVHLTLFFGLVITLIFSFSALPYLVGFLFGIFIGVLNIVWLVKDFSEGRGTLIGGGFFLRRFLVRYGILALALWASYRYPILNLMGFLLGFFLPHLCLGVSGMFRKSNSPPPPHPNQR